jgi:hypothetical protein
VANDDAGGAPLSRKQLHTRTGQAKGWSALLGAHGRPDGGSKGLVDAGYVQLHTTGGQYTYSATPKGRAALVSAQGYHATVG